MNDKAASFSPPACLECGACCFGGEAYVRVTGADWSRLGVEVEHWAEFRDHRAFMRMVDGHCAALVIEPADTRTGTVARFVCAIYAQRPQTCRDLDRGSPNCEAEWVRKRALAERCGAAI